LVSRGLLQPPGPGLQVVEGRIAAVEKAMKRNPRPRHGLPVRVMPARPPGLSMLPWLDVRS
jgi:hypothetical protein